MMRCDAAFARVCRAESLLAGSGRGAKSTNAGLIATLYPAGVDVTAAQLALRDAAFLQPALFAVEFCIAQSFIARTGATPTAVMGHSLGEIVACCVAGVLTLEDAIALARARGCAMAAVPAGVGAMAATQAPLNVVEDVIRSAAQGAISIAAVNGPRGVVISGAAATIDHAVAALKAQKVSQ